MAELAARKHNEGILLRARKGDLLEFPHGLYSHWAVYVGGSNVIHLAGGPTDGLAANDVTVRLDDFWTVADGSFSRINNIWDGTERPFSGEEVVKRAREKLGHKGYSLVFTNCEHFASWCRYGKARSNQVETVEKALAVVGGDLKKILTDAATSHPDEQKRATAAALLTLGQTLGQATDKYLKDHKSDQLKGLKSQKDDPSSSNRK